MLKSDWFAVPEGAIYPVLYKAGTKLDGELLARARALGLVDEPKPEPVAPKPSGRRK